MPSIISASTTSTTALNFTADTSGVLALQTGATPTTAITIDTSQNVGIGTSSPTRKLDIASSIDNTINVRTSGAGYTAGINIGGNGATIDTNNVILFQGGNSEGYLWTRANSYFSFGTNNTERMRIDSSGNVGIGTTTPAFKLSIVNSANVTTPLISCTNANSGISARSVAVFNADSSLGQIGTVSSTWVADANVPANGTYLYGQKGITLYSDGAFPMTFLTNASERMRITSGGEVLIGSTSNPDSKKLYVNGSVGFANAAGQTNSVNWVTNKGAGAANSGGFGLSYTTVDYTPSSASSNIYWDGGTGYFTLSTSARKYKRNITPVTNEQLNKALTLKPSYYQRLEYDYWEYGFIAEEVSEAGLDEFVSRVDGEISGLNYEKMVTLAFGLIQRQEKAIQELKAELDATKAEVQALKESK